MRPLIALMIVTVLVLACGGGSNGGYGSPLEAPPASGAPASGSSAPYDYGY